ncbi:YqzH family protein [Mesobacillus maritimus]|uniref:YqzH family protein n=1 Tax=Mesobacillus maritimus TaxID=1643336 RepID=UPI00203DF287|nr:YqzH family protein [Mesobacillus maritimus]MCM3586422.1 YqzH family protein [Mesobacillus maritimus]MCM3669546.1 YqzH family protein [Mesobacillus maritimus]
MEKKLIRKMIQNCLLQYSTGEEFISIEDTEKMCEKIVTLKAADPSIDLYEAVNDTVYEFLTS